MSMPISFTDRQGFSKIRPDAKERPAGMLTRVKARVQLASPGPPHPMNPHPEIPQIHALPNNSGHISTMTANAA